MLRLHRQHAHARDHLWMKINRFNNTEQKKANWLLSIILPCKHDGVVINTAFAKCHWKPPSSQGDTSHAIHVQEKIVQHSKPYIIETHDMDAKITYRFQRQFRHEEGPQSAKHLVENQISILLLPDSFQCPWKFSAESCSCVYEGFHLQRRAPDYALGINMFFSHWICDTKCFVCWQNSPWNPRQFCREALQDVPYMQLLNAWFLSWSPKHLQASSFVSLIHLHTISLIGQCWALRRCQTFGGCLQVSQRLLEIW